MSIGQAWRWTVRATAIASTSAIQRSVSTMWRPISATSPESCRMSRSREHRAIQTTVSMRDELFSEGWGMRVSYAGCGII
jgi:hypothetical protein